MSKKLDQKDVVPYGHKYSDSDEEDDDNKQQTWKYKKHSQKPKAQLGAARVDLLDTINIIDTYDRPASATAQKKFAQSGTYSSGLEDEPGKRIPKIGAYAEAGVGRAGAKYSVFEAEAKGPNACAGAEASVTGVRAMARAEVASASANAGPVGLKLGLGFDTGASIGLGGVEAKILGTGISIGPKTSISLLGSEASCSVM